MTAIASMKRVLQGGWGRRGTLSRCLFFVAKVLAQHSTHLSIASHAERSASRVHSVLLHLGGVAAGQWCSARPSEWPRAAGQRLRLESTKLMAGDHVYCPDVGRFLVAVTYSGLALRSATRLTRSSFFPKGQST